KVRANRLREVSRRNIPGKIEIGLQDLEIAARQELAGVADVAGVARELHAVLGGAERRRADAFAGRKKGPRQLPNPCSDAGTEALSQVREVPGLSFTNVFGHAAREHHSGDAFQARQGLGEIQILAPVKQGIEQGRRHGVRDAIEAGRNRHVAALPLASRSCRMRFSGRLEADDAAGLVHRLQPSADVQRRGGEHAAVLDDRELGRATADVDVEQARAAVLRGLRRSGAEGGEHRLHVMAGARADQVAAAVRDHRGDRAGVLAAQRFPGQDHHAGVDVRGLHARLRIGLVHDGAELRGIDAIVLAVGRERHGRLEKRLARDDDVAAGERLAVPAQREAREDDLGPGGADVDADARERDMVLDPDRVLLERQRLVEVLVVVVGIRPLVRMAVLLAEEVVGDGVLGAHSILAPDCRMASAKRSISAPKNALNSRAAMKWTVTPAFSRSAPASAPASALRVSASSRATTSGGVPAVVARPVQPLTSKPGKPDSMNVGTPGSCGSRCAVATASARTRPARMCGRSGSADSTIMSTLPATRALIAAAEPWNGTCTMSTFAAFLKSSAVS